MLLQLYVNFSSISEKYVHGGDYGGYIRPACILG
jgi:hypothetical protein